MSFFLMDPFLASQRDTGHSDSRDGGASLLSLSTPSPGPGPEERLKKSFFVMMVTREWHSWPFVVDSGPHCNPTSTFSGHAAP